MLIDKQGADMQTKGEKKDNSTRHSDKCMRSNDKVCSLCSENLG